MAFQVSPGVVVNEIDATGSIVGESASVGGIVGDFAWGPANKVTLITSEEELVDRFGQPKSASATDFLVAAQFLAYSSALQTVRAIDTDAALNASDGTPQLVQNDDLVDDGTVTLAGGVFHARYPGVLGNSLQVVVLNNSTWSLSTGPAAVQTASALFDTAPSSGEVHVAIMDQDGDITGTAGTVLETYEYVSLTSGAKNADGSDNYVNTVINAQSDWVWLVASTTFSTLDTSDSDTANDGVYTLAGGVDGTADAGDYQTGLALLVSDTVDVSLIITSDAESATAIYACTNVAEVRGDAIAFISPERADVIGSSDPAADVVAFRNTLGLNSSYAVMDSGWKQVYNKYQDRYDWIPLNGDIAGLCAQTDLQRDAWFSPAGLTRGSVKNSVKLAWSPTQAQRDTLYKAGVNPVINEAGKGTVLWGDKTMLQRPSAFDRINVRRLFIALRESISASAEAQLFEFNDEFSRANFVSIVEPFLREIQGRRGIEDFRVVCDETNNTASVINANRFVADIFVKPARSTNFITLNLVAVRSGVEFNEIAG